MKSLNPLKFFGTIVIVLSFVFINQNFQAQKKTGENIDSFHKSPLNKENSSITVNPLVRSDSSIKPAKKTVSFSKENSQSDKHEFKAKREHLIEKPVSLTFGPMNNVVSMNYDINKVIDMANEYNLSDEMIEKFGDWVDALTIVFASKSLLNKSCKDVFMNFENQIVDESDLFLVLNFSHMEREKALVKVFLSNYDVISALLDAKDPNNILK